MPCHDGLDGSKHRNWKEGYRRKPNLSLVCLNFIKKWPTPLFIWGSLVQVQVQYYDLIVAIGSRNVGPTYIRGLPCKQLEPSREEGVEE